jgi:uncharacterized membrane protein
MLSPSRMLSIGRTVFAIAVAALGAQMLVTGDFLRGFQPVPAWLPARALVADASGLVLVAACAGLLAGRQLAARVVLAWLAAFVIALYVPITITHAGEGGVWTCTFEMIALGGAAAVLALPDAPALGRICYAASLPVFGIQHFLYRDYVASVIPDWIPGHMFWALATGVAEIAAGASLLAQVKHRLAAPLLALMFAIFVVVVHVPRALAAANHGPEWTSLFVAAAMCGSALVIAGRQLVGDGSYRG